MYVNVDVNIDEILEELTDEEVESLYERRFHKQFTSPRTTSLFWIEMYEARMRMAPEAFLKHIDTIIMNFSGRIICDR